MALSYHTHHHIHNLQLSSILGIATADADISHEPDVDWIDTDDGLQSGRWCRWTDAGCGAMLEREVHGLAAWRTQSALRLRAMSASVPEEDANFGVRAEPEAMGESRAACGESWVCANYRSDEGCDKFRCQKQHPTRSCTAVKRARSNQMASAQRPGRLRHGA